MEPLSVDRERRRCQGGRTGLAQALTSPCPKVPCSWRSPSAPQDPSTPTQLEVGLPHVFFGAAPLSSPRPEPAADLAEAKAHSDFADSEFVAPRRRELK